MRKKFLGHAIKKHIYIFYKEIKALFKSHKLIRNEDKLTFKWWECSFTKAQENQQQHHDTVILDFHQLPRSKLIWTRNIHFATPSTVADQEKGCQDRLLYSKHKHTTVNHNSQLSCTWGKIQNSSFVLCDTQGSTFVHVYASSSCCVFTNFSMKIIFVKSWFRLLKKSLTCIL